MNGPSENRSFKPEQYRGYLQVLAEGRLDPRMRGLVDVVTLVDEVLRRAGRSSETPDSNPQECLALFRKTLAAALVSEAKRHGIANRAERSAQRSIETALEASTGRLLRIIARTKVDEPGPLEDSKALLDLADTIMLLPETERRAVQMRILQNLPLTEICQQLDCPLEKVQAMLEESQRFLNSRSS